MREILFRGKRIRGGEWGFGLPAVIPEKGSAIFFEKRKGYMVEQFTVQPDTIGQFTGLMDKDGKKIFDGDIVVNSFGRKFLVDFQSLINGVKLPAEEYREIIGNIHDNPELLEGEE